MCDRPTGRTDRRTDTPSYRDARTHLKKDLTKSQTLERAQLRVILGSEANLISETLRNCGAVQSHFMNSQKSLFPVSNSTLVASIVLLLEGEARRREGPYQKCYLKATAYQCDGKLSWRRNARR